MLRILVILFFFSACSLRYVEEKPKNLQKKLNDSETSKKFRWKEGYKDEPESHAFYDNEPIKNQSEDEILYIPLNKIDSTIEYSFDFATGTKYQQKKLCVLEDGWSQNGNQIFKFPFDEGFIPRALDKNGKAVKIFVFGDIVEGEKNESIEKARLIGSIVVERCHYNKCNNLNPYTKEVVLIGVKKNSFRMKKINSVFDLKDVINWSYFKAFVENRYGSVFDPKKSIRNPAVRFLKSASMDETKKLMSKNILFLDDSYLKTLQNGCFKIFNSARNMLENLEINSDKVIKKPKELSQWMKKNYKRFYTCSKFVKDPEKRSYRDINEFFKGFVAMHVAGFFFDCNTQNWIRNTKLGDKKLFEERGLYNNCSTNRLYREILNIQKTMDWLRLMGRKYYKYIVRSKEENKLIRNWVEFDNNYYNCIENGKSR